MAAVAPGPENMNALNAILGVGNLPGNPNFFGQQGGMRLDINQLLNQLTPQPGMSNQIMGQQLQSDLNAGNNIASGINNGFAQANALSSVNMANQVPLQIAQAQQAGLNQRAGLFAVAGSQQRRRRRWWGTHSVRGRRATPRLWWRSVGCWWRGGRYGGHADFPRPIDGRQRNRCRWNSRLGSQSDDDQRGCGSSGRKLLSQWFHALEIPIRINHGSHFHAARRNRTAHFAFRRRAAVSVCAGNVSGLAGAGI